jgi:hypothetical protein
MIAREESGRADSQASFQKLSSLHVQAYPIIASDEIHALLHRSACADWHRREQGLYK